MAAKVEYIVLEKGFREIAPGAGSRIFNKDETFFGPSNLKGSWFEPKVIHQRDRLKPGPKAKVETVFEDETDTDLD